MTPFSDMKDTIQNEFKYYCIDTWVILFVVYNLEFYGKVVVVESPH